MYLIKLTVLIHISEDCILLLPKIRGIGVTNLTLSNVLCLLYFSMEYKLIPSSFHINIFPNSQIQSTYFSIPEYFLYLHNNLLAIIFEFISATFRGLMGFRIQHQSVHSFVSIYFCSIILFLKFYLKTHPVNSCIWMHPTFPLIILF